MTTATRDVAMQDKAPPAIQQIRAGLAQMESQFQAALPPHIPVARFVRVVMTALQNNPKLQRCTRQSLFNACMQAAQDGLLPDGREGAIIPFGDNEDGRASSEIAKWLPMVAGIRKKVRNSGALVDWNVQVVQEGDEFAFQLGDAPFIHHKPSMKGGRGRPIIAAYSIAKYPDGSISREVMNADQIADIESKSKSRKGPWSDPIFRPEMARKTVAKLHAKQLPMSTDLDTVLRRDDDLYDFKGEKEAAKQVQRPGSAAAALEYFAAGHEGANGDGAVHDSVPAQEASAAPVTPSPPTAPPAQPTEAKTAPPPAMPRNEDEYRVYAKAIIDASADANGLREWFKSQDQRKLRNACGITSELFAWVEGAVRARCEMIEGHQ